MAKAPLSDEDRDDLTAFLDGEADPETRARVESRLQRDPRLRAEADALKQTWAFLDNLPQPQPSANFTTRTIERLSAFRPSASLTATLPLPVSPRRVPWVLLACCVGGLMLGWLAAGLLKPKGPPPLQLDDPMLVRDLRLLHALPQYSTVESVDFLHELDHPDRFGADALGP